jgi:hypothetical protein
MLWHANGVIPLYPRELGLDLTENSALPSIQEAMMHRHLYAHASGLLDADYIGKIKLITGQDLMLNPAIRDTYPAHDTYWFEPLCRLPHLIEEARSFFSCLSASGSTTQA